MPPSWARRDGMSRANGSPPSAAAPGTRQWMKCSWERRSRLVSASWGTSRDQWGWGAKGQHVCQWLIAPVHPLQGVGAAQGVISVPKAVCILGAAAPGTGVSPSCRAQRLSGTLPPHASSFRLMGYKKILNGLIAARVGVFQAQPGHSREFRLPVIAEINGRLVCDQLVGPVHPPEPLTGLSSGTARCACICFTIRFPLRAAAVLGGSLAT